MTRFGHGSEKKINCFHCPAAANNELIYDFPCQKTHIANLAAFRAALRIDQEPLDPRNLSSPNPAIAQMHEPSPQPSRRAGASRPKIFSR